MRVCITIDTEFSIAGAFADASRLPVGAPMVNGTVHGQSHGLGFLLDCFQRHGVQATFFVETAQRCYFQDDPMRGLARQAATAGHEVQLHVHPCWTVFQHADWFERVQRQPRQDDFAGRPMASTLALLRHGQAAFADWGLPAPQVFRAGNLQYDDALYRALAAAGIAYSSNIGLGVYDGGLPGYRLYAGRHMRHGVVECPVLTYRDRGAHLKSLTIRGASFTEMRMALEQAHAAGLELVVILTHPFEYVHLGAAGGMRRHALNQARMERLCCWLAAHPERFQTCGLAAAASLPLTSASSQNPLLRGSLWQALSRIATQSAYAWYSQLALAAGTAGVAHGTWRGSVKAWLARTALHAGRLEPFRLRHPAQVRRVVFVCLGNICRSAYAHRVAERLGMQAVSVGLATVSGAPSPDEARRASLRCGEDLLAHRASNFADLEPQPGDLFVAMEIRHAHELQRRLIGHNDVQIAMLGLWCDPPCPHLHDPFTLGDAYFDQCFMRIRQAVYNLNKTLNEDAS